MDMMDVRAEVAATPDAIAKVFALRSAVFMIEQQCPYEEEFDGNDFCAATHILGTIDGEPAGVLRVRFFADFVKIERLAVLPRFRGTSIARKVIEAGIEIARRKGYRKMYGHSQVRLMDFWAKFGFRPMAKNFPLVYSDHDYIEVSGDLEPHPDAITIMSDPYLIVRPEGHWDIPGPLDLSSERPATNPH